MRAGPWARQWVRPDGRDGDRAAGAENPVVQWAGFTVNSDSSQATNPVAAYLPSRGEWCRIGAPTDAVQRGSGEELQRYSVGWQGCGTWG